MSENFGGGFLSQIAISGSFGGTELLGRESSQGASIVGLLTYLRWALGELLGGIQQPAIV